MIKKILINKQLRIINKWESVNEIARRYCSDKQQILMMFYFHLAGDGGPLSGVLL